MRRALAVPMLLLVLPAPARCGAEPPVRTMLDVPIVRQSREHCGQAALEMVLRYYGANHGVLGEIEKAYDPVLRGSLITDLAAAARRAGFGAVIATWTPDSLVASLESGVPPIVLYQNGRGPFTVAHFGVVIGWDPIGDAFTLHDGRARPRVLSRGALAKRWRTSGAQALIVYPGSP